MACRHFCVVMSPTSVLTPLMGLMATRSTPITRLPTGMFFTATWHHPPAHTHTHTMAAAAAVAARKSQASEPAAHPQLPSSLQFQAQPAGGGSGCCKQRSAALGGGGGGAPGAAHRSSNERAPDRKSYVRLSWMSLKDARER